MNIQNWNLRLTEMEGLIFKAPLLVSPSIGIYWDLLALPEMDFHCRGCIKFRYFVRKKLIYTAIPQQKI